jgi:hypothetical protein
VIPLKAGPATRRARAQSLTHTVRMITPSHERHIAIQLLNELDAAALLGLSPRSLRKWRWAGKGPRFRKLGRRVLYELRDLEAFIEAGVRESTSQNAAPPSTVAGQGAR